MKNGLSRLWWYANISYNREAAAEEDPYEYTRILLYNQDVAGSICSRLYSDNYEFVLYYLKALKKVMDFDHKLLQTKRVQQLAKFMQRIGGNIILDSLTELEVEKFVFEFYDIEMA